MMNNHITKLRYIDNSGKKHKTCESASKANIKLLNKHNVKVEINNKYLNNQNLIHFEMIKSKIKLIFEYDNSFAKKWGLEKSMYLIYDFPTITIEHDFSNCLDNASPFGINVLYDFEENKYSIE